MATYDNNGEIVDFEIGDVVVLNSGGPDMTVTRVVTPDAPVSLPYPNAKVLWLLWISNSDYHLVHNIPDRAVTLVRDNNEDEE